MVRRTITRSWSCAPISGIKTLEDMKGHSLAWADPNSTSGYLIPSATLKAKGIKLDDGAYFSKTGFSGGHEQGVVAVLNKQYDGAVTWTSGQGEKSEGYTRGNLRSMVDKKMLKMSDVNIIWQSGKIPNGPWAVRIALPAELKKTGHGVHARPAEVAQGCLRRCRARLRRRLCAGNDGTVSRHHRAAAGRAARQPSTDSQWSGGDRTPRQHHPHVDATDHPAYRAFARDTPVRRADAPRPC